MKLFPRSSLPDIGSACPDLSQFQIAGGKIFQVIQNHQVPLPLAVLSHLGVTSFLIQGLVDVKKPNGQVVPPSLYCVGIADSGERKSTIENEFTKTIYRHLSSLQEEREKVKANYRNKIKIWEAKKNILIKKISKLSVSIAIDEESTCGDQLTNSNAELARLEEYLKLYELEKPEAPKSGGLDIFSDTTPPALIQGIGELGINSAGVFTSEGEEFLKNGFNNFTSSMNKAWSGEGFKRNRVGEHGDILDCRLTLSIQMQPAVAEEVFFSGRRKLKTTGTAARMLLACPQSMVGTRWIGYLPDEDERDFNYQRRVEELLKLNSIRDDGARVERTTLVFSLKATERWFVVANEIEGLTGPGGRFYGFGDLASKLPDNMARVSANIHVCDYGLEGEISEETLNEAIKLCCYFSDEYIRIFREHSEEYVDAIKLDHYLSGKRSAGVRYILKSEVLTYGPLRKAARLDCALRIWQQQGIVFMLSVPRTTRTGRKTKPTYVVDLLPQEPQNYYLLNQVLNGLCSDGL